MYFVEYEGQIILADMDKEKIEKTFKYMPQYNGLEIKETDKQIVTLDGVFFFKDQADIELAKIEATRIANLKLTAADVERGIYKAKGMDFDDIISLVQTYPQEGLDVKALKIELKANHFYRGNPYVSVIGTLLGFTEEQLNKFFEDGNYEHLLGN